MASWVKSKFSSKSKATDVDDSNVDAVIARNLWKNHRIIPPNSKNKQNWDLIMVMKRSLLQWPCCLPHVKRWGILTWRAPLTRLL